MQTSSSRPVGTTSVYGFGYRLFKLQRRCFRKSQLDVGVGVYDDDLWPHSRSRPIQAAQPLCRIISTTTPANPGANLVALDVDVGIPCLNLHYHEPPMIWDIEPECRDVLHMPGVRKDLRGLLLVVDEYYEAGVSIAAEDISLSRVNIVEN